MNPQSVTGTTQGTFVLVTEATVIYKALPDDVQCLGVLRQSNSVGSSFIALLSSRDTATTDVRVRVLASSHSSEMYRTHRFLGSA